MKNKFATSILALALAAGICVHLCESVAQAQGGFTNATTAANTPGTILSSLQGFVANNDTNCNVWNTNRVFISETAAFQNVSGVPGASPVGNVLGAEIPLRFKAIKAANLGLDAGVQFENVAGNVEGFNAGAMWNYNICQIQMSLLLDCQARTKVDQFKAAPGVEFKKAALTLWGFTPEFRWTCPIQKKANAGTFYIGGGIPF